MTEDMARELDKIASDIQEDYRYQGGAYHANCIRKIARRLALPVATKEILPVYSNPPYVEGMKCDALPVGVTDEPEAKASLKKEALVDVTDLQTISAALKLWGDTKKNAVIDWHTLARARRALSPNTKPTTEDAVVTDFPLTEADLLVGAASRL